MNQEAILNMLQMQHRMNSRVHEDWINQHFEWYAPPGSSVVN